MQLNFQHVLLFESLVAVPQFYDIVRPYKNAHIAHSVLRIARNLAGQYKPGVPCLCIVCIAVVANTPTTALNRTRPSWRRSGRSRCWPHDRRALPLTHALACRPSGSTHARSNRRRC